MRLFWSTKILNGNKKIDFTFTGPDRQWTTPQNNLPLNSDTQVFTSNDLPKSYDCKVVLEDVLTSSCTEKFNVLESNLDNTHSVSSHKAQERQFLEKLTAKDPIQWPKMDDHDSWEKFDATVSNLLLGKSSVSDRVVLLEETVYNQGALYFGYMPTKQKRLKGLNRRAQYSINLVKEKN